MEAILDTNFIVGCVKRNIDFVEELRGQGFKVLLPREVVEELKDLRLNVKHEDRMAIELALEIVGTRKLKKTKLGNSTVDAGLIALGKHGAYIATLDRAIKRTVPNTIAINDAGNSLIINRA